MAESKGRVLVIEHSAEVTRLVETVLDDEGFEADWVLEASDTLDEVGQRRPDLLIVDLLYTAPQAGYELLDHLRADPAASRIPVLAITDADPVAHQAVASYNVRATVTKPFDLEDLVDAARRALQHPIPPTVPSEALGDVRDLASRILAQHSREALLLWVQRLQSQPPWRDRKELGLPRLLNSAPVLVEALTATLQCCAPDQFLQQHPEMAARVRQHTLERRQQGIPLPAVVHEYTLLRDEILELFRRHLPEELSPEDAAELARVVDRTLHTIVDTTLPAYTEAEGQASGGTTSGAS